MERSACVKAAALSFPALSMILQLWPEFVSKFGDMTIYPIGADEGTGAGTVQSAMGLLAPHSRHAVDAKPVRQSGHVALETNVSKDFLQCGQNQWLPMCGAVLHAGHA